MCLPLQFKERLIMILLFAILVYYRRLSNSVGSIRQKLLSLFIYEETETNKGLGMYPRLCD